MRIVGCVPSWASMTLIVLSQTLLLSVWICREYFVFDYRCLITQFGTSEPIIAPQRKLITEKIFKINEIEANETLPTVLIIPAENPQIEKITIEPEKKRKKIRKKKRPTPSQRNPAKSVQSIVRIEPLVSYTQSNVEGSAPQSLNTKTTRNRYRQISDQMDGRRRRRRKKKRPAAERRAALVDPTNSVESMEPISVIASVESAEQIVPNESTQTAESIQSIGNFQIAESTEESDQLIGCLSAQCLQSNTDNILENQEERWRTHGIGGPPPIPGALNFTEQLRLFASRSVCIGRAMADGWALLEIFASIPFLLGIFFRLRCLFSPFLILFILFLVILFVYAATLTLFSLILFLLVDEMSAAILLEWMLFAAALDALFIFSTLFFVLTLQFCDSLLIEFAETENLSGSENEKRFSIL